MHSLIRKLTGVTLTLVTTVISDIQACGDDEDEPSTNHSAPHDEDGEIHNGEDHCNSYVFLSLWNVCISSSLICLILLVGIPINAFDVFALWKNAKKTNMSVVVIHMTSLINIALAQVVPIPMVLAAILVPSLLTENYCYVQETITVFCVIMSIFSPALISVDRLDTVTRKNGKMLTAKTIGVVIGSIVSIALFMTLFPIFGISSGSGTIHEHGCHMWSEIIDAAVWFNLISCACAVAVTVLVMLFSYGRIFSTVSTQVHNMEAHNQGMPVNQTVTHTATAHLTTSYNSADELTLSDSTPSGEPTSTTRIVVHQKKTKRMKMHKKVAMVASCIVVTYVTCWMPLVAVNALFASGHSGGVNPELRVLVLAIAYIPFALDPVLHMIMSPQIMDHVKRTKAKLCR